MEKIIPICLIVVLTPCFLIPNTEAWLGHGGKCNSKFGEKHKYTEEDTKTACSFGRGLVCRKGKCECGTNVFKKKVYWDPQAGDERVSRTRPKYLSHDGIYIKKIQDGLQGDCRNQAKGFCDPKFGDDDCFTGFACLDRKTRKKIEIPKHGTYDVGVCFNLNNIPTTKPPKTTTTTKPTPEPTTTEEETTELAPAATTGKPEEFLFENTTRRFILQQPFLALISYDPLKNGLPLRCTAMIISQKWLLTSIQCALPSIKRSLEQPPSHEIGVVYYGEFILRLGDPAVDSRTVSDAVVSQDTNMAKTGLFDNLDANLALLELNKELKFTRFTQPIKLATSQDDYKGGDSATFYGWEVTVEDGVVRIGMRKLPMVLLSEKQSVRTFTKKFSTGCRFSAIMERAIQEEITCHSDMGGAMVKIAVVDNHQAPVPTAEAILIGVLPVSMCHRNESNVDTMRVEYFSKVLTITMDDTAAGPPSFVAGDTLSFHSSTRRLLLQQPFMALVSYDPLKNSRVKPLRCTAMIISSKWLVTSYQCALPSIVRSEGKASHEIGVVYYGEFILKLGDDLDKNPRHVINVMVSPDLNMGKRDFFDNLDVNNALLELDAELKFTRFTQPIKIADSQEVYVGGDAATFYGWEVTMEACKPEIVMRKLPTVLLSAKKSVETFSQNFSTGCRFSAIMERTVSEEITCHSDMGGAMVKLAILDNHQAPVPTAEAVLIGVLPISMCHRQELRRDIQKIEYFTKVITIVNSDPPTFLSSDSLTFGVSTRRLILQQPFMVLVTYGALRKGKSQVLRCSGIIYSSKWIITSYQCALPTLQRDKGQPTNEEGVVHFGEYILKIGNISQKNPWRVIKAVIPSEVDGSKVGQFDNLDANLALLQLDRVLTFSRFTQAIKIPDSKEISNQGDSVTYFGWHVTPEFCTPEAIMRKWPMVLLSGGQSQKIFSNQFNTTTRFSAMLTKTSEQVTTCHADMGGALVKLSIKDNHQAPVPTAEAILIGLLPASMCHRNESNVDSSAEGVEYFTKISKFSTWAVQVAGSQGTTWE